MNCEKCGGGMIKEKVKSSYPAWVRRKGRMVKVIKTLKYDKYTCSRCGHTLTLG